MRCRALAVAVLAALASVCVMTGCSRQDADEDLATLAEWMTGSFSSQAQSYADTNYYDIRLEMTPVWTSRDDGHWFYVEQAVATYLDHPYRQRVYHLTEDPPGTFRSDIYLLRDPIRFAGVWREDEPLAALSPDSLTLKDGCTVFLAKTDDGAFEGETVLGECGSELHGASYATSEVRVTNEGIVSWDRGWDAEGNHVWGAERAGYVFDRVETATVAE